MKTAYTLALLFIAQFLVAQQLTNWQDIIDKRLQTNTKSATARSGVELLDSMVYFYYYDGAVDSGFKRHFFDYNEFDEHEIQIEYNWDAGIFEKNYKISRLFNNQGLLKNSKFEGWNSNTDEWEKNSNIDYTYSNNNLDIFFERKNWDGTSYSINYIRNHTSYTTFNSIDTFRNEFWDATLLEWYPGTSNLITYNTDNNRLVEVYETYLSPGEYLSGNKHAYSYNNLKLLDQILTESRSKLSDPWEKSKLSFYYYNDSNELDTILQKKWDDGLQNWVNEKLIIYSMNPIERSETITTQNWANSTWVNFFKEKYFYMEQDKLSKDLRHVWNGTEWELYLHGNYYYSQKTVSTNQSNIIPDLCRFANPLSSTGMVQCELGNIKNASLEVYDLLGRLRHHTAVSADGIAQIGQHLPAGVYIITLKEDGKLIYSKKMIKQ